MRIIDTCTAYECFMNDFLKQNFKQKFNAFLLNFNFGINITMSLELQWKGQHLPSQYISLVEEGKS